MKLEFKPRASLRWFLAGALILHFSLGFFYWDSSLFSTLNEQPEASKLIEIERVPETSRKPVVQTSKSNEVDDDSRSAALAGEFRNRVKKETQARVIGPFQEGQSASGNGAKNSISKDGEKAELAHREDLESESEVGGDLSPKISDLMILGRSPHYLSDKIEKGNQTVLNTDKVLYASFINRIAEEVYQPWVGHIQDALKILSGTGKKLENNIYVTKLNVAMDKHGEITGIQILSSCGVSNIDEAPKKAFWEAEPFPNPPLQLIDDDGFIRLNYEFHFEWKSSGFNIVPMTI